ncbi:hypothetical protein J4714_11865 [Staphylococcus epidermidis]|nr:hypothetical protein [Staphylococcus epidermidis]MBO1925606.1 hypothetical protein [Staphylococcus epidermidis]MBO1996663.1 hypothetical protein [Staphylococcus epidermidis]
MVDYGLDIEEELNTPQAQMMIQNLLQKTKKRKKKSLNWNSVKKICKY